MEDGLCFFEEGESSREWLDPESLAHIGYTTTCQAGPDFPDGKITSSIYGQLVITDAAGGRACIHLSAVNGDLKGAERVLRNIQNAAGGMLLELRRLNARATNEQKEIEKHVEESTDRDQVASCRGAQPDHPPAVGVAGMV